MPKKLPLSVAIITKNEEDRLPDCLGSVVFAEEVVVVDSGSTDRTVAIAKECGAKVFEEAWHGFGPQKQMAIDNCSNDWVLVLDADERVSEELAGEIAQVLGENAPLVAYSVPRKNYFCGRWLKHAGWWPDRVVRLFLKDKARMSQRLVHEAVETEGPVADLSSPLIHFANKGLEQTLDKVNKYSTAGAEELYGKGKSATVFKAILRAKWAFFHNYILRRGILDGPEGFVMAISDFMNVFFKYAKLRELQKNRKSSK